MTSSHRRLGRRTGIALSLLALPFLLDAALDEPSAQAAWPPPESATPADLSDPANWPNDPDYVWTPDGSNGQWNYYSFMVPNENVRPEETATGMSIDMAWRFTTGDPRVIIVVTDSGIKWDERDVIEAAFINHRELLTHRPTHEDGSPCGDLDPTVYASDDAATRAGFDCNGDGIITVADYAETPTLLPAATETSPRGDRNANGVLDAGDLILNLSDGIDDDANGYVDDISGWDFMKDDNDPYDDTRYGHGTGEARDSTSRANNGIGSAGGCGNCRVIHARVGDSFITDVNDFGQAVIYATDMKAKLVQSALGTVNNNRFTQAALDYAWDNGVITVASMADENARHHNMPTVSNHTLPVHAIQYSGERITEARTFLQYHPCSNYGGQNFLSAPGTGCSSEATGQTSGVVGLVWSAGLKYGIDLEPGEVFQLMIMGADDIYVPESQEENAVDRWSQPGFDQRFGYGRVNANNAVEAVKDGRIPPVVDVVSPTWFSVLYKDQVTSPVPIEGSVSAKRATSYDYLVEWAPGVQPLDGEFKVIEEKTNIPPTTVSGASEPLAELDIRALEGLPIPQEKWDKDSYLGENQHTITVRVRSVAHYGGAIGDVRGELRRTYYVHEDPDLVKGFPIFLGDGGESSPKMADIDGDGVRELLYGTAGGELHVLKVTSNGPEELPGFPFKTRRMDGLDEAPTDPAEPSYLDAPGYQGGVDVDLGRESLSTNAPAIADLDEDGKPEIVMATYAGTIYVLEDDGSVKDGWPVRLERVPSCSLDPAAPTTGPCMSTSSRIARGTFSAPVLADMDKDGDLDIILSAFDGKVHVFDLAGAPLAGWPVEVLYDGALGGVVPPPNRVFTTPALADFNGDGYPDMIVGSNQLLGEGGNAGAIYILDGRGTNAAQPYLTNWPVTMTSLNLFPLVAEGVTNSAVVGTINGTLSAVAHGNGSPPLILPLDPGAQSNLSAYPPNILPKRTDGAPNGLDPASTFGPLTKAETPNTMLPLFSQPALGDMDQDGSPDIVASGGSLTLALNIQSPSDSLKGDNLLAMWSGVSGRMLPASPMVIEDFTFFNSSAIADLTGDGYPEAIIGSGGYYLHAFDGCGREPEGWPKFTGQWIIPTPSLGDVDGDGTLEVAVATRNGWLYAWHTGASDKNLIEWESYHHDNRNTGNYDEPLEQGGPRTAAEPITQAFCEATMEPPPEEVDTSFEVSGGCSCDVPGSSSKHAGWLASLALLGLVAARGNRGRRS